MIVLYCYFCPYADTEVVRPYTPVEQNLAAASHQSPQDSDLYLMIKVYPDGVLTPHLNSLSIGKSQQFNSSNDTFSLTPTLFLGAHTTAFQLSNIKF